MLLLTRPRAQAESWQRQLALRGIEAQTLPLIDIAPSGWETQAHAAAALRLHTWQALVFVSPSAVAHFCNATLHAAWQATRQSGRVLPRLWAPGPGTATALQQQGFAAAQIDQPAADAAQFESETLWQTVQAQVHAPSRILILRGQDAGAAATPSGQGRDWLARQIRQRGAECEFLAVYERRCPIWSPTERALATQAAHSGATWLCSSSQALAHLQQLMPAADWSRCTALATHPRIAATAQAIGFGTVQTCRPDLDSVVATVTARP